MNSKHLASRQAGLIESSAPTYKRHFRQSAFPCWRPTLRAALGVCVLGIASLVAVPAGAGAIKGPVALPTPAPGYGAAPVYADRQAGSDMCAKIVTAMKVNPGGAWIQIPAGRFVCTTQLLVPNDGQNPPHQSSYKISGAASGGVIQFFPDNGCRGGTILDMRYNAATGKIDTRGLGKLEIDHICFMDSATDFTPFVFDTLTVLQFHHNQIMGNPGHFPAGCCPTNPPTQDGQTGIILGGQGLTVDGTPNSMFQGYGTSIDHNQFDYCGQCVVLGNESNSLNIESNHFFNHITNTTHGPITIDPGASGYTYRTAITNNLIEVGASKYGIHLVRNVSGFYIAGNSCWDSNNVGVVTFACVREEPSAGNLNNHVINVQQDFNTGTPLPDQITAMSSRQQNGRFLGAIGAPGANDCTKPIFGASHADGFGLTLNGGATQICSSSHITHIFDNMTAGDHYLLSVGGLFWQNQSTSLAVGTGPDTGLTRGAAGEVDVGTTSSPGDKTGTLGLTTLKIAGTVQDSSGAYSMGMTLRKGSGAGDYTSNSTSYAPVDGSNLALNVTIPAGWKLLINASGTASVANGVAPLSFALADNSAILVEQSVVPRGAGAATAFSLNWIVTGDGGPHAIDLRFKTGAGSDSVDIANSSATNVPVMTFMLLPSN